MSPTDVTAPELTDPELISRVREGDVAAYGTLFSRHVDPATRLARLLIGPSDADDLVSEAFVKVLNVLLAGGGPDVAFRAYLLTAVRRLHIDKVRSNKRLTTTDDLTPFDPGVPFTDTAVAGFEGGAAAKAFASLPERWQMVLWHLEVENQKPADIAPLLGLTPNSVSALAYRAREGLRQAFLTMHAGDLVSDGCRDTNDLLSGYVRGALSRRDGAKVEEHLEHCRRCTAVYLELSEVNSSLAAILGPAVLGSAAAAYLGGGAATGIGAGVLLMLGRGRDLVTSHVSATAATAAVIGVAAVTAIAIVAPPQDRAPSAERPAQVRVAPTDTPSSEPDSTSGTGKPGSGGNPTTGPSIPAVPGSVLPTPVVEPAAPSLTEEDEQQLIRQVDVRATGAQDGAGTAIQLPGTGKPDGTKPKPKPKPTKKPRPDTRIKVDVGVKVRVALARRGGAAVTVQVTGVPWGRQVVLSARSGSGDIRQLGVGCRRSTRTYTCTASAFRSLFLFNVEARTNTLVAFSVSTPAGYRDTSPRNNRATVHVAGSQGNTPTIFPTTRVPDRGGNTGGNHGGTKGSSKGSGSNNGGTKGGTKGHGSNNGGNHGQHSNPWGNLGGILSGILGGNHGGILGGNHGGNHGQNQGQHHDRNRGGGNDRGGDRGRGHRG